MNRYQREKENWIKRVYLIPGCVCVCISWQRVDLYKMQAVDEDQVGKLITLISSRKLLRSLNSLHVYMGFHLVPPLVGLHWLLGVDVGGLCQCEVLVGFPPSVSKSGAPWVLTYGGGQEIGYCMGRWIFGCGKRQTVSKIMEQICRQYWPYEAARYV